MGKRKKASKPPPKKKQGILPVVFQCLFCNHEKAVVVKLEKKLGIGQLNCKVCGQTFQTGINYLSAPIDVYYDWVDACEKVAAEHKAQGGDFEDDIPEQRHTQAIGVPKPGGVRGSRPGQAVVSTGSGYVDEDDDDGFVVDDEPEAEGEFNQVDDDDE